MRIHVIIPYYNNAVWLSPCIKSHVSREDRGVVCRPVYHVIVQDGSEWLPPRDTDRCSVVNKPMTGIGGQPLPAIFQWAMGYLYSRTPTDLVVLADTDTLMLQQNWNAHLAQLFADPEVVVAGINPRSETSHFQNTVEWNWLAFRPEFWAEHLATFDPAAWKVHDIGHLFTEAARVAGKKAYRWPFIHRPFEGKSAAVCGSLSLAGPRPWVLHAFYASRKHQDRIPEEEKSWILTEAQEAMLFEVAEL